MDSSTDTFVKMIGFVAAAEVRKTGAPSAWADLAVAIAVWATSGDAAAASYLAGVNHDAALARDAEGRAC